MRAFFVVLYVGYINLHVVAFLEVLAADLLALGEHSLALADLDRCDAALGIDPLDGGGNDLAELALELKQALTLLTGADTLTDNVARCGDRDSAELLGVERDLDLVADLEFLSLVDLLGFF